MQWQWHFDSEWLFDFQIPSGTSTFDWVGFDWYGIWRELGYTTVGSTNKSVPGYLAMLENAMTSPSQRAYLMPDANFPGTSPSLSDEQMRVDLEDRYFALATKDSRILGLFPFAYSINAHQHLRGEYASRASASRRHG